MAAALFVDAFEIRVAQKARRARESGCFLWRHGEVGPDLYVATPQRGINHHALGQRQAAEGLDCESERHRKSLLAEAGFHGNPLPSLGAAAGNYLFAALGLHARAKTMLLASLAPVGLECTLRHEK